MSIVRRVVQWVLRWFRRGVRTILPPRQVIVPTSPCLFLRLGVPVYATQAEIDDAYRRAKVAQHGPHTRTLIEEAYATLGHPTRREIYVLIRAGLAAHGLQAPLACDRPLQPPTRMSFWEAFFAPRMNRYRRLGFFR